jgi:hypothetical protein
VTFSASVDNATATVDGSTLTVSPDADFNGSLTVTVTADDGELEGSGSFTLAVNAVNDAPVVDAIDSQTVAEDTDFVLTLSASDVDGDAVTFSASVDGNGSASVDGSTLTVTPATDYNGDITVTVSASDGSLAGTDSFTLTVTPVNDAPVVDAIADQVIDEDALLTLTLSASDVDGDALTFSATNGNATITVDGSTLTVTPEANYNGDAEVTVNVTDGEYTSTTTFILTVTPVNDAPVLDALVDAETDEDTAYSVDLSSSDVDGDTVTYSASTSSGSVHQLMVLL